MLNDEQQQKEFVREFITITFNRIATHINQDFEKLAEDNKATKKQLFVSMLNNYKNLSLEFNETEVALIKQAKEVALQAFKKAAKKAILQCAKKVRDMEDQLKDTTIDPSLKNSARSADVRADTLITKIFEHNELADNWYDKTLLTKSSVLDFIEKQKQLDPETIAIGKVVLDRCLERNKELIQLHHEEHELKSNHNVKAHYERLKITKGDKL